MSFSNNAHKCKSILSFAEAEKYFNNTEKPRGAAWESNERPLYTGFNKNRMHQYRLVKLDGAYACTLHDTAVVTFWPDKVKIDVSWQSQMTRDFAGCYLPFGWLTGYRGQRAFQWNPHRLYYKTDSPFVFSLIQGEEPKLLSEHSLCEKIVVDKTKSKPLLALLKSFNQYVDGVWGLSDPENDVRHPWVGVSVDMHERFTRHDLLQDLENEEYVKIVKRYLGYTYSHSAGNNAYLLCRKQTLKARVKENLYIQQNVHISIPYNQVA